MAQPAHQPARHPRPRHHPAGLRPVRLTSAARTSPSHSPPVVYTLARETHDADLSPGAQTKIQHSFSYSDGFGREIQKKIQAEPGPVPQRDASGKIIVGADGQPKLTPTMSAPAGSAAAGRCSTTRASRSASTSPSSPTPTASSSSVRIGVSPVLFYDPVERVVATLHPNHTCEKVVFDPWQQTTWDVNDTVASSGEQTGDPRTDPDIAGYVAEYFKTQPADLADLVRTATSAAPWALTSRPPRTRPLPMPTRPPPPISTRWAAPS